jgi:hypothetical protein
LAQPLLYNTLHLKDESRISGCAAAIRALQFRGIEVGHYIRHIIIPDDILFLRYDDVITLSSVLEIVNQAIRLITLALPLISSPALLSCLKQTCRGTLTSLRLSYCSVKMIQALGYIGDLKALTHLSILIGLSTPWPSRARPWDLPLLQNLTIEPARDEALVQRPIACSGLLGFLCNNKLPALTQFTFDLSSSEPEEGICLCRFLDLHADVTVLGLFLQGDQLQEIAPHIRATTFTPVPLDARSIQYIPDFVNKLCLWISDDIELEDLWDTLLVIAQLPNNISSVALFHYDKNITWFPTDTPFTRDLPVREAQLAAGLLRFAILLKAKNIQLLDSSGTSIERLMGLLQETFDQRV